MFPTLDTISPRDIGFDIDGVVADTMAAFVRVARDEFGIADVRMEQITSYWLEECLPIPNETVWAIIGRILDDPFGVGLEPIPGAREALLSLAVRGDLTFVTARPSATSIEPWLRCILPEVPCGDLTVIATGKHAAKARVLRELGLRYFLEDHLETCQDLCRMGIGAIVFDQPWNRGDTPFYRVSSWGEFLGLVE
jgi:uncharacterized HAD superfamily protein